MPNANPVPRPQATQVVNPVQSAVKPNRNLEGKLDRLMFGSLSSNAIRFGLE